jgi:carbon-monoxide dehydrogenase iron sulfur subunit
LKRLILDHNKCTGCCLCQLVCSLTKRGNLDPSRAMVRISKDQTQVAIHVCIQCIQKVCKEVCLPHAIAVSSTGATIVDDKKCDGCEKCIGACVNRAILVEEKLARICDLCEGTPACAAVCPTGALTYQSLDEQRVFKRTATGQKMIKAMERRS